MPPLSRLHYIQVARGMKYRIITHVHTKYSHDSLLPFFLLYNKCIKKGVDYIAITEHNNIKGAVEFKNYCANRGNKLKVIIGEEIMTSEGEIIGLFLNQKIKPFQSPDKTVDEIKKQHGIVYIPHPYDEKRYKTVLADTALQRIRKLVDCIECHNGRNISSLYDKKQMEIAVKYDLRKVIGSDAHTIFEVGYNYMESSIAPDSAEKFKEALALDGLEFYPHGCLKYAHQLTRLARLVRLIERGKFNELYRIILRKFRKRKPESCQKSRS